MLYWNLNYLSKSNKTLQVEPSPASKHVLVIMNYTTTNQNIYVYNEVHEIYALITQYCYLKYIIILKINKPYFKE